MLRKMWDRIEKYVIYISLAFIIIIQVANYVFPDVIKEVSISSAFILFSAALIAIYKNVDEKRIENNSVKCSSKFFTGLGALIEKQEKIDTLDIFSHTSMTYYHCIKDCNIKINCVRLLVCKPKCISNKSYPDQEVLAQFEQQRDSSLTMWKELQSDGLINELKIKYYEFDPTYHFAIINNKYFHYGFFKITHEHPGYSLLSNFTYENDNELAQTMLNDFVRIFNNYYYNFSYEES